MTRGLGGRESSLLTAAAVGGVLLVCLRPSPGIEGEVSLCLLCGDEAVSNLLANVLLYLPLGAALRLGARSLPRVAAMGLLLSVAVEVVQLWIPGRFSSPADVLANGAGAIAGALLSTPRALRPPPALARVLTVCAAAAACGAVGLSAWLLRPAVPDRQVFVGWNPDLGGLPGYPGRVLSASVGGEPLPSARAVTPSARVHLERGERVDVSFEYAGTTPFVAPLFHLPVGVGPDVLFLGVLGDDLFVRRRLAAAEAKLTAPAMVYPDVLSGYEVGDEVGLALVRDGGRLVLEVDGSRSAAILTSASGWRLIHEPLSSSSTRLLLDLAWLGLLLAPIGYWAPSRAAALVAGVAPLGSLALVPLVGTVVRAPAGYFVWGVAVLLAAHAVRKGMEQPLSEP